MALQPTPPSTQLSFLQPEQQESGPLPGFLGPEQQENGPKRHEQFYETSESLIDPVILRVGHCQLSIVKAKILMLTRWKIHSIGSPDITSSLGASSSAVPFLFLMPIWQRVPRTIILLGFQLQVLNSRYTSGATECKCIRDIYVMNHTCLPL
jgi:hypothetical protein